MSSDYPSAEPFVPERGGLAQLRRAADTCQGCPLYRNATQTVFGSGPSQARVMFVGEQPGDREDRAGEPFVGPAGGLLDRALEEAGISRDTAYLTNVVKHFKFVPPERGKRRIHQKPSAAEMAACWPWLVAELRIVRAEFVVCLGASAAKTFLGNSFRVSRRRGEILDFPDDLDLGDAPRPRWVMATVHPSSVVRAEDRHAAYQGFLVDLTALADAMEIRTENGSR